MKKTILLMTLALCAVCLLEREKDVKEQVVIESSSYLEAGITPPVVLPTRPPSQQKLFIESVAVFS